MNNRTDNQNRYSYAPASLLLLALLITLLFVTTSQASDLHGFVEGAGSVKLGDERAEKNSYNLGETRAQLKYTYFPSLTEVYDGELSLKGELLYDGYKEELSIEIRDLNLFISPAPSVDMKIGRQILTWGTGDLLFVNDLFPKDYVSFFTGRATEYLKLPSDAVRAWYYHDAFSLDLVLIPRFQANRSIRGKRLSFYDGLRGSIEGTESTRTFITPKRTIKNAEVALRAYKTVKSYEAALYLFKGFYKEPRMVLDSANELFTYPRLRVYGASLRGPVAGGIANVEVGYYDSRDDTGGADSSTENSSVKYLFGFTRDLAFRDDLKVGVQYMVENMLDYGQYKANLPAGEALRDKNRHLATLRLTSLLSAQTIDANLFLFYSPTDRDLHLRPSVGYKATDTVKVTLGANIFSGSKEHTQFGSLEGNNNLYLRARYSF
ncbi:MAG: hypothetical protein IME99_03815 [Proteobacteria bacterium]|nr:hypothetical protein [Pseudomonadota bacterium]